MAFGKNENRDGGFMSRLRSGLSKTRNAFGQGMATVFLGARAIDEDLFEDIETQLLTSDMGIDVTHRIMDEITTRVERDQLDDVRLLKDVLREAMRHILMPVTWPLKAEILSGRKPFVVLVLGVNGAGKTTTIGKMAHRFQKEGKSVMLAAGDTFRAAAVEQLQVWGERNRVPVVAQPTGSDSASVIFDAMSSAQARGIDVLIADTAGRLHNKANLMDELAKIKRVLGRLDPSSPHETLLVVDACAGQNALRQAEQFHDMIGLTGIAMTKLDGTAKGGIVFAMADRMKLPIRYIGVGEKMADLRTFDGDAFIEALFEEQNQK
jgi:fused signal recognition particle receptor